MAEEAKPTLTPALCADHDAEKYSIQIELPGAKKEDIELMVNERSFCIIAPRKDAEYRACYNLAHEIIVDKVEAEFDSGLLNLTLPLKHSLKGKKIAIK